MDRFTYALVAGVLALVAGGLATAIIARGWSAPPDLSTPGGVVLAYAAAEQRGDALAAWNLLDPSVQARSDRDAFLAQPPYNDRAYLSIEDERIEADGATVVLVRTYPGSGGLFGGGSYPGRSTVRLAHTDAGWRITVPDDSYRLVPIKK